MNATLSREWQHSALPDAQAHAESAPFGDLEQWIAEHLKADLRVEALTAYI